MFLSDPGFICQCFCYLGLKELIHCTSLSMEYVLSFSCSGLRWRIFSSMDKFNRLFHNMHQHTNQIHIYSHCKYTIASGKVQKIELSTEIHCHSMSLSEILPQRWFLLFTSAACSRKDLANPISCGYQC